MISVRQPSLTAPHNKAHTPPESWHCVSVDEPLGPDELIYADNEANEGAEFHGATRLALRFTPASYHQDSAN